MSRIGKKPIVIPEKVEVQITKNSISVKGPKGQLTHNFSDMIKFEKKDKTVVITPSDSTKESSAMWGTARALISNMFVGVTTGFTKELEFTGVGYKAQVTGDTLNLSLGYSHQIDYKLPPKITAKADKNLISITGMDKELVGFVAAKVRSFRPPEPYKGKGIKYATETILRKAGKA